MTGITNFLGGTGGIILIPTVLLPIEWEYFTGSTVIRLTFKNQFWIFSLYPS
jgi:hypothetical protein